AVALFASTLAFAAPSNAPTSQPSDFLQQVKSNFGTWDLNHNGELSKEEIEQAVADPDVSGKAAAAVAALRRAARGKSYKLPPLTVANIAKCVPHPKDASIPDFDGLFAASMERIGKVKRELFAAGVPDLTRLHQGKLGDCFCLAPLGAMVY